MNSLKITPKITMTQEAVFNREVAGLIRTCPTFQACIVINEYMKRHGGKSYYYALQRLGVGIGIEYQVIEVENPRIGKVEGWWPAIKYSAGNPKTGKEEVMTFMSAPYDCPIKCYDYLARNYVYKLNDTPKLALHVLGEEM
ncbi:hypothetical protein [Pontibacter anaerobius]|uniref:Uncharacterized protein n=1 Tax=Pontibacter anaerobius TaxID=2993940 RepID=A0ABT3RJG2_9BACT|nr:hypothetical protein [Pontibacter anaerobius]MCX2741992.1 hypothetical protein [Pontibacter anaerobius]